uniref:Uncharacterized protein n=1 Tax=Kalanchoe fedtschenkoi TaxID=63787 RepID=A0A7N0UZR8_KALFE
MSWLSLSLAGGSFIWIGSWEALADPDHHHQIGSKSAAKNPRFYIAVSLVSLSFLVNSLISLSDAAASRDRVGSALQLQLLALAALFLLFSVLGLLTLVAPFPPSLLDLVCLFAFMEEFVLFYSQRKDASGIENRYFDLMLFPVAVCFFSTLTGLLKSSESRYPRLARGVGLILQGTWLLQMGISFYTRMMVQGCSLHEKSRGNYTIRCTGHPEYHRGRAIATLQFNCHLAFMVVLATGLFSLLSGRHAAGSLNYKPIGGAEMLPLEHPAKFTLDSDDEDAHMVPGDKIISVEKSDAGEKDNGAHL